MTRLALSHKFSMAAISIKGDRAEWFYAPLGLKNNLDAVWGSNYLRQKKAPTYKSRLATYSLQKDFIAGVADSLNRYSWSLYISVRFSPSAVNSLLKKCFKTVL